MTAHYRTAGDKLVHELEIWRLKKYEQLIDEIINVVSDPTLKDRISQRKQYILSNFGVIGSLGLGATLEKYPKPDLRTGKQRKNE